MWENKMVSRIFILIGAISILLINCVEPKNSYKQRLAEMGIEFSEKNYVDCIIQGNIEAVRLFLLASMSPDQGNQGCFPLVELTRRGYSDIALALIDAGVDVDSKDVYSVTAAMFAAICGSVHVLERLIEEGADVNVRDVDGHTLLIEMLTTENDIPVSAIQSIIDAGADPNIRIEGGLTPLMLAATGDPDVLRHLIDAFENKLWPAARAFKPDALLISAGFDSRTGDPLGRFRVTDRGYQRLTQILLEIAQENAEGRLISALEGGYSLEGLSKAIPAHIAALMRG